MQAVTSHVWPDPRKKEGQKTAYSKLKLRYMASGGARWKGESLVTRPQPLVTWEAMKKQI